VRAREWRPPSRRSL
jgi:hypothetical protein